MFIYLLTAIICYIYPSGFNFIYIYRRSQKKNKNYKKYNCYYIKQKNKNTSLIKNLKKIFLLIFIDYYFLFINILLFKYFIN